MHYRTACTLVAAGVAATAAGCGGTSHRPAVHLLAGPASTTRPMLVATMKGAIVHKAPRYGLAKATVTFTVGERGMPPGSGIPRGSVISVLVSAKSGRPEPEMVKAYGRNGHYTARIWVPPGGIGALQVGGFLDVRSGPSAANGDYWIPVTFDRRDF